MSHDCRMGYLLISEDEDGELWVKFISFFCKEERKTRINYCPLCGEKSKTMFLGYFPSNEGKENE